MKRSLGLTLVGVLVILLSALFLAVDIFAVIAVYVLPSKDIPPTVIGQPDPRVFAVIGLAFMVLMCGLGIVNGIGLIKRWVWCRYVTMIFGFIAAGFAFIAMLFILFIPLPPTPGLDQNSMTGVRTFVSIFYLFWAALFLFIALFLVRKRIADEFRAPQDVMGEPRPLAVWTVAGLLLIGLLSLPMMFVIRVPMLFFGMMLPPITGRIVISIWIAVAAAIGVALFRRVRSAFAFAVGIYLFGLINGAVTLLVPGASARFEEIMRQAVSSAPYPTQFSPMFLKLGMLAGLCSALIPLTLLMVGRKRYFEWCERSEVVQP